MNTVDPDRLRSVEVETFEDLTILTSRQTSRRSPLETFGLDVSRDIPRAVTGEPRDSTFAAQVTGKDALYFNGRLEFASLGKKCEEMLVAYRDDKYKERFGWIDQMRTVRDQSLVTTLDEQLVEALRAQSTERLYLAPPEPLDWTRHRGFQYPGEDDDDEPHVDLDVGDYLSTLEDSTALSIEDIKKNRVAVLYTDMDQPVDRWYVYQCVIFETERTGRLYVLTGGRWFEIARDFADSVNRYIAELQPSTLALPDAHIDEAEKDYNSRAAQALAQFVLMDERLVACAGGQGRIEVCDLFSSDSQFIHVKRRLRSATLSHLFAQGTVSGEAFVRDAEFRRGARERVAASHPTLAPLFPEDRPNPSDYEVVYAIIAAATDNWPLSLPFFSQLHLRQASQRLQALGYNVSLLLIPLTQA